MRHKEAPSPDLFLFQRSGLDEAFAAIERRSTELNEPTGAPQPQAPRWERSSPERRLPQRENQSPGARRNRGPRQRGRPPAL